MGILAFSTHRRLAAFAGGEDKANKARAPITYYGMGFDAQWYGARCSGMGLDVRCSGMRFMCFESEYLFFRGRSLTCLVLDRLTWPKPYPSPWSIAMVDHDDDLPTRKPNTRNTNPQSHCSECSLFTFFTIPPISHFISFIIYSPCSSITKRTVQSSQTSYGQHTNDCDAVWERQATGSSIQPRILRHRKPCRYHRQNSPRRLTTSRPRMEMGTRRQAEHSQFQLRHANINNFSPVSAILSSVFFFSLDQTIVADIIPDIVEHFGAVQKLPWISVTLLLAAAGTINFWYSPPPIHSLTSCLKSWRILQGPKCTANSTRNGFTYTASLASRSALQSAVPPPPWML